MTFSPQQEYGGDRYCTGNGGLETGYDGLETGNGGLETGNSGLETGYDVGEQTMWGCSDTNHSSIYSSVND